MGKNKDIGQLFENKLNDGKKIPNTSLWEKINASLEEEKRRKKRIFFFWLLSGGVSILLGLLLLVGNQMSLYPNWQHTQENSAPVNEQSSTLSEDENNETPIEISKENVPNITPTSEEKLSKIILPEENREFVTTENPLSKKSTSQQIDSENKSTKTKPKHKSTDENFTVTKNYYYYNSKDGKQIVTKNKDEIDSLISKQYKSLDSITSKKINSPEE